MKRLSIFCLLAGMALNASQMSGHTQTPPQPMLPYRGRSASPVTTEMQAAARARAILAQQYRSAPKSKRFLEQIGGPWRLGNWASPDVSRHAYHQTFDGSLVYDGLAWFVHFTPPVRPTRRLASGLFESVLSRNADAASAHRDDFTLIIGDQGQDLGVVIHID